MKGFKDKIKNLSLHSQPYPQKVKQWGDYAFQNRWKRNKILERKGVYKLCEKLGS